MSDEKLYAKCQKALEAHNGNIAQASRSLGMKRSTFRYHARLMSAGAAKTVVQENLTLVEEHQLRRKLSAATKELRQLSDNFDKERKHLNVIQSAFSESIEPPKWSLPARSSRINRSIVTSFLSDLHLAEVVKAAQVEGQNSYNTKIAEMRLKNFFQSTIRVSRDYINGIKIEGLFMPFGGDFVSGNIHEELQITNAMPILESIWFWAERLVAGINMVLEHFEKIHIPCVVGNHGRLTRKPNHKNKVVDNYDWILYNIVAKQFENIKEVTFDISPSSDISYNIYKTRYLLRTGDQFRGGGGIAGLLSPLMIGEARKRRRAAKMVSFSEFLHEYMDLSPQHKQMYDYMIIGHWHQYSHFKSIIVNGSLKGYDEYAYDANFDLEPPQQAWFLTDPKHGKTFDAPLFILDKNEKRYWE